MKIIHENCDKELAEDRTLPYTAYLVEYQLDGLTKYDIVTAPKRVDIFDHYWDKYRNGFINMTQTEGRVKPKLWGYSSSDKKKKK